MADTASEKGTKRDWPVVTGLDADSKHEGRQKNLVAQEESLVLERHKVGIRD